MGKHPLNFFATIKKAIGTAVAFFFIKCLVGVLACYYLYVLWPAYPFEWAMISVVLPLSFDNSKKPAFDRIISNMVGCVVGLALFPIDLPQVLLISVGVTAVIVLSTLLKLGDMVRPALAGFVIVMLREEDSKLWFVPLQRVCTVMAGCIIALLLTFLCGLFVSKRGDEQALK